VWGTFVAEAAPGQGHQVGHIAVGGTGILIGCAL
jgi:hypothetical protein